MSYNRSEYLCEAIESVLAQTVSLDDVFVLDNGSDDAVRDAIDRYVRMGVHWKGAPITRSVHWNFRRAVSCANSEYIFIMHDDDRLCPDFVEMQFAFMETHPDVIAVSCNGYVIDQKGNRNSRTVLPVSGDRFHEVFFKCSVDVATRYASDSCLPFSSVMYRTKALQCVDLREDYGKVCDAVFLCDLADVGSVAYRSIPLYECRVHSEQDSAFFSPLIMDRLEDFLWNRKANNIDDLTKLHALLVRQHTMRMIVFIVHALKNKVSFNVLLDLVGRLRNDRFSIVIFWDIVMSAIKKRLGYRMNVCDT